MKEILEENTYQVLTISLGKEFVDKSLLNILGFDDTLDIAESDNFAMKYGENASTFLPGQIANILSDMSSAITFARERIMTSVQKQEQYYYGDIQKDRSGESIDDVKIILTDMMDDMVSYLDANNTIEAFTNLMIVFRMDFVIRQLYAHLFGTSVSIVGDHRSTPFTEMLQDIDFGSKLMIFLEKLLSKIKNSSQQDQSSLYIMSEFLRAQSGERDGIGNSMNPMSQSYTLDHMGGPYYSRDIQGLFPKMIFMTKQYIPNTKENIRSKMQKILEELNTQYCFPQKYSIQYNQ